MNNSGARKAGFCCGRRDMDMDKETISKNLGGLELRRLFVFVFF